MNILMRDIGQIEQSYDGWNEWKFERKNPILNDKNEFSRRIWFFEILYRILSMIEMKRDMIEMKREKPSEVEGSSLRKLKLFMNALFLCDHL